MSFRVAGQNSLRIGLIVELSKRGIRNVLQNLEKAPPQTVLVNYAVHGMQMGGTVYMLPRDADLGDSACDLNNKRHVNSVA